MIYPEQPILSRALPDIADSTLVGSWLTHKTPSSGKDYSTVGNDGVSTGIKWNKIGGYFDGASYLNMTGGTFTGIDTVEFWFKTSGAGSMCIINDFRTNRSVYINGGKINFRNSDNSANLATANTFNDNAWHYGLVNIENDLIYLDGEVEATEAGDGLASDRILIGARHSGGYGSYFIGDLACLNAYATPKSASFAKYRYLQCVPEG